MKKISVIIPTYNRAHLLGDAIQSVRDQSYPNCELIVVDDGSTDETAAVVQQFGSAIKYVRQEHRGVNTARNNGFSQSTGEFILPLDSDDRLFNNNLETLFGILEENPAADVAYGWFYWMNAEGAPVPPSYLKNQPESTDWPPPFPPIDEIHQAENGRIFSELCQKEIILMGTALFSRRCVEAVGGFDPEINYFEHWEFMLRVAQKGFRFVCAKEAVTAVRLHGGNRSENHDGMLRSRLEIIEKVLGPKKTKLKTSAMYQAYMYFVKLHFRRYNLEIAAKLLNQALQYAPLAEEDKQRIRNDILTGVFLDNTVNPLKKIKRIFSYIKPKRKTGSLRREVISRIHRALAHQKKEKKFDASVLYHAAMGILYEPASLLRLKKSVQRN